MPDKLIDAEIVKALECCNDLEWMCPQCKYIGRCKQLQRDALDLINRLQAENEKLNTFAEIKKEEIAKLITKTKAEAYKECIEKVKEHSNKTEFVCSGALVRTNYIITDKELDNLLKELVGEQK